MSAEAALMDDPKPFASLGATLLARKGAARPAMRPQSETRVTAASLSPLDDLGWNDMGDDGQAASAPAPVRPVEETEHTAAPEPEVRRQQEVLAKTVAAETSESAAKAEEETAAEPSPAPAPVKPAPKQSAPRKAKQASKPADARRAAFTLRLDPERHLKLRLASTIRNRSAQHIVTEALDKLLAEMPELNALARQVSKN